nr:CDP-glycerol glycerophosphotransferase family protein [uncultured Treponema sp.]
MLLYIDPGTGSMLFSIVIGIATTLLFFAQRIFVKLKFILSGGKAQKIAGNKIPYVIFADHKRYWNVFKPICDEFENRKISLVYWTASPDDPALSEKYEHVKAEFIGEGNKAFARLNMMNAGIVLSTTPGLDVYQWKKSRNVDCYVHIFHEVGEPLTYRMFGVDAYDALLFNGTFQEHYIRLLEAERKEKPKECKVVGCCYLDSMKKRLDKEGSKTDKKAQKTVLLAPSWGQSAILSKYGKDILNALIKTGYKIIVRPHPQSFTSEKEMVEKLEKEFPESENFKWNRDNDNFDVLNESDLLITDFSGVVFDFTLVFDKPIIYADTSFNSDPYDASWIDEPLWRFEKLKELGIKLDKKDFPKMKEMIDSVIENKELKSSRERVRNEAWQYQGQGAEKTVDWLIEKYKRIAGER